MVAPNTASSDSWDKKDDSLWAVFISVLELGLYTIWIFSIPIPIPIP